MTFPATILVTTVVYELENEEALTTPEMRRVRGWGEMFPHLRNFHERVYTRIHEHRG